MPPKKKLAAVAATPVTSGSANGSANGGGTPTTMTTKSSSSLGQKKIQWFWAGDSGKAGASQDTLVEYDGKMNTEIESQYQDYLLKKKSMKLRKFVVDKERYIDFKDMVQTRYDDESKMRTVERQEITVGAPVPAPVTKRPAKKKAAAKRKQMSDSEDESSSSSSESDSSDSDDDSDDDDDYHAKWYWAGDSNGGPAKGGGHQDIWIAYDKKFCQILETALTNNEKRVKVDADRFIDLQNMLQRRYDDEMKRRNVKREDPKKIKPALPVKKKLKTAATVQVTTSVTSSTGSVVLPPITTTTTTNGSATASSLVKQIIKCPSTWTDVDGMDYKEVDVLPHEKEFGWMSDLFAHTVSSKHKGITTLSPIVFNHLKVTRVVRVQNPALWMRYHSRKDAILAAANGQCPKVKNVLTQLPNGPEVDDKANEIYLFHGLNISSVTGISKFGFDPRFCSLEGMFGAGLYFAENSSKSNQYCHAGACTCSGFQATSCRCSQKDEMCLLVCRVVLGDSLIENVFRGNAKGDFWYGRRTEPKKPDGISIHNSVIGESKDNYGPKASLQLREYIVYESSQVYVEYKVYFKRIK